MIYCYGRVSTRQQNLDRQLVEFEKYKPYKLITDKESGKSFDRPNYQKMRKQLKEDDTLIVLSLDRFGRNYDQIKSEWQYLTNKGVKIKVIDMPIIDTTKEDLTSKLISDIVLQLLSYVAQSEYDKIHERQAQGIAIAKQKGVVFGRPRKIIPQEIYDKYKKYGLTAVLQDLKEINVSKQTFFKEVKTRNCSRDKSLYKADFEKIASQYKKNEITLDEIKKQYNSKNKNYLIARLNAFGCDIKTDKEIYKTVILKKLEELLPEIETYKLDMKQVKDYCGGSAYLITRLLKEMGVENYNCIRYQYKAVSSDKIYKFSTLKQIEKNLGFSRKTIVSHINGSKNCIDKYGIKIIKI